MNSEQIASECVNERWARIEAAMQRLNLLCGLPPTEEVSAHEILGDTHEGRGIVLMAEELELIAAAMSQRDAKIEGLMGLMTREITDYGGEQRYVVWLPRRTDGYRGAYCFDSDDPKCPLLSAKPRDAWAFISKEAARSAIELAREEMLDDGFHWLRYAYWLTKFRELVG